MLRFIRSRLLEAIPVLFIIATLTFVMIRLAPGGPFSDERNVSPATLAKLESHYHLDEPLPVQYLTWWRKTLTGDLGPSMRYGAHSVNEIIGRTLPVSLELGILAITFALIIGLGAGIIAGLKPNTVTDYAPMSLAMIGICIPTFVIGPLLLLLFALRWQIFSVSGWDTAADRILPAVTLGAPYGAYIARLTRAGMLEVLNQDFIRTARAKGVSEFRIIYKHALKGGLLPVIAFLGPATAGLLSGSFVVEEIFDIPGLGQHFVNAAFNRDYTMIMGTVLLYAVMIVVFNLLVDIIQAALNPRLRLE
ncbi:MAG TPA: ABC transporter [Lentisphaeria bacterium]|nr:ABC transporter [Lentisphaeria bacterium]|tara:strand:- start:222 stop:1139 length:918 start_codon:yes stop_codon:yes gene_type:complete